MKVQKTMKKTFRDAYGVLQRHAQTLREQDEPHIDDLLSIVTESVTAYKVCQERIAAVEQALEKALGTVGESAGAAQPDQSVRAASRTEPAATPARAGWDTEEDGDLPF